MSREQLVQLIPIGLGSSLLCEDFFAEWRNAKQDHSPLLHLVEIAKACLCGLDVWCVCPIVVHGGYQCACKLSFHMNAWAVLHWAIQLLSTLTGNVRQVHLGPSACRTLRDGGGSEQSRFPTSDLPHTVHPNLNMLYHWSLESPPKGLLNVQNVLLYVQNSLFLHDFSGPELVLIFCRSS